MTLFTVDVSHHNGTLDWARISRAGVFAGMAKATQGASFVDSQYANNIRGMRGAGLVPGAYHFLTNENASSQVSHFLSHAGDIAGSAVMLDVEPNGSGTMKPTMASVRAFYSVWASRVPGKPLLLYLPYWYWLELGSPSLTGLGPLVASHYLSAATGFLRWCAVRLVVRLRRCGPSSSPVQRVSSGGWVHCGPERLSRG